MMKRFLRISLVVVLVLAAVAMGAWYFFLRRTVPAHAQCIPKNAFAVVTLNVRELALDQRGEAHLFPGMEKKMPEELNVLLRAIKANDGSGLKETADVLAFGFQVDEDAFFGVAMAMDDEKKFGSLVQQQLSKNYRIQSIGNSLVQFDTTSAVMGWNTQYALFLYPISNSDAKTVAACCTKLLTQTTNASVLSSQAFREHELSAFDAGVWIQAEPLLHFTNAKFLRTSLFGVDNLSFSIDFREGETSIRRLTHYKSASMLPQQEEAPLLVCDPKEITGFVQLNFDPKNAALADDLVDGAAFNALPFSDEEAKTLLNYMNGNCTLLLHDTLPYSRRYITYKYDEDFNQVTDTAMKRETELAMTYAFGLSRSAENEIHTIMEHDSIPYLNNAWTIDEGGLTRRMMLTGETLVVTTWPSCDGKLRPLPADWQSLGLKIDLGKLVNKGVFDIVGFFFPQLDGSFALLAEQLADATATQPVLNGMMTSSDIRIRMKNTDLNALVQFEDIFRKGMQR